MNQFSLIQMLGPKLPMIDIADVGAMWLGEDNLAYLPILKAGAGRVVGFEPNPVECGKLNALGLKDHRYLPYFIGDGRDGVFRLCTDPATSSLYEPNLPLLKKFNMLADATTPVRRIGCKTRRLDDIAELTAIDLLKVDVQGAERDVIRGGERLLKDAVMVMTEVEFVEMYVGQPLFADVDAELRRQGFVLHMMNKPASLAFKPVLVNGDLMQGVNQIMWSDACYVRDFMRFQDMAPAQLLKLSVLLHEMFESCDLAALALQHYDAKTGEDLWARYMGVLCPGGPPPKPPLS